MWGFVGVFVRVILHYTEGSRVWLPREPDIPQIVYWILNAIDYIIPSDSLGLVSCRQARFSRLLLQLYIAVWHGTLSRPRTCSNRDLEGKRHEAPTKVYTAGQ